VTLAAGDDESRLSTLWLDEFGRLTNHVLHGLRNGLQGVGINLEVIRSRTEHGGGDCGDLRTFASNASRQFEDVSAQVEALAYLSKNTSGGTEVGPILRAIAVLLNAGGKRRVTLEESPLAARIGVDPMTARLILTHMMLTAVETGSEVTCTVSGKEPVSVAIQVDPSIAPLMNDRIVALAQGLHIKIGSVQNKVTATFPTTLSSDTVLV
jgi:hypothetical protein